MLVGKFSLSRRAASKRYGQAIVSAECANVHRILLQRVQLPAPGAFGKFNRVKCENLAEWIKPVPEPDFQVAGYIVQSVRTLDKRDRVAPIGGEFFDNDADAIDFAKDMAQRWSANNPGLIVFKAIKHVHSEVYTPVRGKSYRVAVDDVDG